MTGPMTGTERDRATTGGVHDAITKKKLRLYWDAAAVDGAPSRDAVLEAVWAALRQRHDPPGTSQDEKVEVHTVTAASEPGTFRLAFRYVFDRDFASQYDEKEAFEVELVVDATGALLAFTGWNPQGE